jgi:hypothetical protein
MAFSKADSYGASTNQMRFRDSGCGQIATWPHGQ